MTVFKSEVIPEKINWNFEIILTIAGLIFTCGATIFLMQDMGGLLEEKKMVGYTIGVAEQIVFTLIVMGLIYGNVVYQLSRLGFLVRDRKHQRKKNEDTLHLFQNDAPPVMILIPSYKEEIQIIYQTLMSAALQQYPNKRIVLLIDDPACPIDAEDVLALDAARALPEKVAAFLEVPKNRFMKGKQQFLQRWADNITNPVHEALHLATYYEAGAVMLEEEADSCDVHNHTDRFFVQTILYQPAQELRGVARSLRSGAVSFEYEQLEAHYNRLIAIFSAELSFFERKRYENLSHEKNKAMNLNTYIGLIGKSYQEITNADTLFLEECSAHIGTLRVPDAEFIITLDADSLILPHYAARLIHMMVKSGNEKLAVVQTPYSAIPGATNLLERMAGATTDIQLLIHQGFTWCGATFWVGANALLRKKALEDIKIIEEDRGYPVTRYIQDRTVIEDTESSIDLVDAGWSLHNYPARMAYSATPSDYGSLLIQRCRWANGGLIILPKLFRHIIKTLSLSPKKLAEALIRIHYLASIAISSGGVLILILYPFEDVMRTLWLPLSAVPYFYLYARDLKLSGYKWMDLLRVYALNLMLVPINIGGVMKSIQQGITREKIPFARTPKIGSRTTAPSLYVFFTFAILAYCLLAFTIDAFMGRWMHAMFSAVNAAFFAYACTYFLGWKQGLEDIKAGWKKDPAVTTPVQTPIFENHLPHSKVLLMPQKRPYEAGLMATSSDDEDDAPAYQDRNIA